MNGCTKYQKKGSGRRRNGGLCRFYDKIAVSKKVGGQVVLQLKNYITAFPDQGGYDYIMQMLRYLVSGPLDVALQWIESVLHSTALH